MEGRVDPQRGDVPFALPEGPLTASVRGLDVPEGARDVWILGAPRPGGLSAEALANGEVRLRVERGLPPAVLSVDPGARSLATLLADAPGSRRPPAGPAPGGHQAIRREPVVRE
jgi:hypothetical protein